MKIDSSLWRTRGLSVCLLLFTSVVTSVAHEDNQTHARLTIASFLFLDQTYPADGALFPPSARGLVRQGSIDEDDDPLYFNHFFNPKTGQTIDTSGFPFNYDEVTAPVRASNLWTSAIQQYRSGQTNNAFSNLGHIIHLLQDMTSPAHVHLDPHGDPRFFVPGEDACGADTDDFENWGYCDDHGLNRILDYVAYTSVTNSQIRPHLSIGLQRIFGNQPQVSTRLTGENTGYAFVRDVANKVYDFTSFQVTLDDTSHPINYDPGAGELKLMFPSLIEYTTSGWFIGNIGWSQGECGGNRDQAWWLDDWQCNATGCGAGCTRDEGWVYIENVGGGDGGGFAIPDNLRPDYYRPASYIRPWFQRRYSGPANGQNISNVTMLRIYGDVLYPAAVAYGAGLLQAFLDEAIMPKPITDKPAELTGVSARLTGRVQPAGEDAWAWFEWGTTTNYGSATTPIHAGTGQGLTNVSSRIEELALDTVYHCRIVASNRFGVRHGTNQTFRTPAFLVTGNVPNAWQITDRTSAGGSTFGYLTNLTNAHRTAATNNGFRYQVIARLVTAFNGTVSINMSYGLGTERYLIWWTLDQNGDLIANLDQAGILKLTTNGTGSARYHTHEIVYDAGSRRASYLVDGVVKTNNWAPSGFDSPAGQIAWGAGSSSGMGQMNFHKVEFQIIGSGVMASYHAGYLGNPSLAPNPMTQGWTANPASPPPLVTVAPISPDFEPYLPLVETLDASEVRLATARLNGRGDPRGENARAWFEWGTSATYGNATSPRELSDSFGWSNVVEGLTGLAADQPYHYRLVVSNAFTVVFGADQTFVTTQPVTIVATAVPQPGQFRLRFTGAAGAAYEVLRSSDLSVWTSIGPASEASAGMFEFTDLDAPTTGAFYQIRSTNP